jgi:hypothetical protein
MISRKGENNLICKCVTKIDPAIGWFEIHLYHDRKSITVANIAEQELFSRYPWPTRRIYDRGSDVNGKTFQAMVKNDYGTNGTPIIDRNSQAHTIVERVHQVIGKYFR